jgi:hypothetical protein
MSVVGSLDAIAVKAETMAGLKRCYSATGGGVSSAIRPIPRGVDDGPVGVVWIGSATTQGGNAEHLVIDARLDIWVQAADPGYAYKTLAAFCDLARTAFRSDMDLGGEAARCQFVGWDEPEAEEANGRTYLVLPLRLETLIVRLASDASA